MSCISCGGNCDKRALRCRQCSNKIVPPNKGNLHSLETKEKISKSLSGNIPWNKGTACVIEKKTKEELSKFRSDRMRGDKNPSKRKEVKEKISSSLIATYKARPEILENRKASGLNQYSGGYTSIEKSVADVLKMFRIPFIHNHRIGRFFADFLILGNIVIECDGTYWHKDKKKDARKDAYLMEREYYVFRLSEERIKKDVYGCTKSIIEILKALGHKQAAGFQCDELPFLRRG